MNKKPAQVDVVNLPPYSLCLHHHNCGILVHQRCPTLPCHLPCFSFPAKNSWKYLTVNIRINPISDRLYVYMRIYTAFICIHIYFYAFTWYYLFFPHEASSTQHLSILLPTNRGGLRVYTHLVLPSLVAMVPTTRREMGVVMSWSHDWHFC